MQQPDLLAEEDALRPLFVRVASRCLEAYLRGVSTRKVDDPVTAPVNHRCVAWPGRRVHFMRNVLSVVPKGSPNVVAAIPADAEHDWLAFAAFPQRHWRQNWSTIPLERFNKEFTRRTDVVGIFPDIRRAPAPCQRGAG